MQLRAGIVPPAEVLAAVAEVIHAVEPAAEIPESRRGLLGRLSPRASAPVASEFAAAVLVPANQAFVHMAGFGNLTTVEVQRVAATLAAAAATWRGPTLRIDGLAGAADDGSLVVALKGEIEQLVEIAHGVTRCVERLDLFVDRRRFAPVLTVATLPEGTPATYVERLRGVLADFSGEAWQVDHLALLRLDYDARTPQLREVDQIPLAIG